MIVAPTELLPLIQEVYEDATIEAFTALHALTSRTFGHCALCLFAPRVETPATRTVTFPPPIGDMRVCDAHFSKLARSPEC